MVSRYLVIALAFIAAGIKAQQGAVVEATGLAALGAGLTTLRLSSGRPILRLGAFLCFGVMALAVGIMLLRRFYVS